jgi:hypothetical protein
MPGLAEVWDRLWRGQRSTPTGVQIPHAHVDGAAGAAPAPFRRNQDYFQIIVNELFLASSRKWFTTIDPLVLAVSEFTYGSSRQTVPYVVGAGMLKGVLRAGVAEPAGMIYRNTRVAGVHPYRGGSVAVSLILCQVPVNDAASRIVGVIEGVSQALDFATALAPYAKIGQAILQGFNSLTGVDGVAPIVGWRGEFDREGGRPFTPGWHVIIDRQDIDPATLWVREGRLYHGATRDGAKEFRAADFVLFSIVTPPDGTRSDLIELPFWRTWERVEREASVANAEAWQMAKVSMSALDLELRQSPDLTDTQAEAIADEFTSRMVRIQQRAVALGQLSDEEEAAAPRRKALSILELKA